MDNSKLSTTKKFAYLAIGLVLAALLLSVISFVLKTLIRSEGWVQLVQDVDHRMVPSEKFKDLNSDNIRSPYEANGIESDDFNIVFLGDSYIHGFILQYKLAPPAQLEKRLRNAFERDDINVWNFGWTTSSPILQLRLLQDIGAKYQPDLVVLSLDMTDYKDDYVYSRLINKQGLYGTSHSHPRWVYLFKEFCKKIDWMTSCHKSWFGYSGEKAYFIASEPMEENMHLFEGVKQSLNDINEFVTQELDAKFIVFVPPRHWQYTDKESLQSWDRGSYDVMGPYALENYKYFQSIEGSTAYPVVPLLDTFKNSDVYPTTFEKDSHWNKKGAQLMADSVFNYLKQHGYLKQIADPTL